MNESAPAIELTPLCAAEVDGCVELIRRAMDADEARWARRTIDLHLFCRDHGIDDGRCYYLWKPNGPTGGPRGIVGLHHYVWGPDDNVWLAWFAVAPNHQARGVGAALIQRIQAIARNHGYTKLFIETYDHPTFVAARRFYERQGFTLHGRIDRYRPDDAAMLIYMKPLT